MNGVKDIAGIMDRCVIDEETGCWIWRAAVSCGQPKVWIPQGVLAESGAVNPAARAAWLLAGNTIGRNQVVYRTCGCQLCVAPEHGSALSRKSMGAHVAKTGRWKNNPNRTIANAKNRAGLCKPREVVQQAEQMFADGVPQKTIREQLGLTQRTAAAIKRGMHPHSTAKVKTVRMASVFSLGVGT